MDAHELKQRRINIDSKLQRYIDVALLGTSTWDHNRQYFALIFFTYASFEVEKYYNSLCCYRLIVS